MRSSRARSRRLDIRVCRRPIVGRSLTFSARPNATCPRTSDSDQWWFMPDAPLPTLAAWTDPFRASPSRVLAPSLPPLHHFDPRSPLHTGIGWQSYARALRRGAPQEAWADAAAAGNRAEALRVYSNCRKLFRDELGATPSPQTEAVFLQILRAAE